MFSHKLAIAIACAACNIAHAGTVLTFEGLPNNELGQSLTVGEYLFTTRNAAGGPPAGDDEIRIQPIGGDNRMRSASFETIVVMERVDELAFSLNSLELSNLFNDATDMSVFVMTFNYANGRGESTRAFTVGTEISSNPNIETFHTINEVGLLSVQFENNGSRFGRGLVFFDDINVLAVPEPSCFFLACTLFAAVGSGYRRSIRS